MALLVLMERTYQAGCCVSSATALQVAKEHCCAAADG